MSRAAFAARLAILAAIVSLVACESDGPTLPEPLDPPSVVQVSVRTNPLNGLSLLADVTVSAADSVRGLVSTAGEPSETTPFVPVISDTARVLVLGLLAESQYELRIEAVGPGGVTTSDPIVSTTGALPPRLAELDIQTSGTTTHPFTLVNGATMGTPGLVYAFDSAGRIRWYREFTEYSDSPNPAKETKQQPNGNVTVFIGESSGYEFHRGRYVEVSPAGSVVREYEAGDGLYTDGHELLLTDLESEAPTAHLFAYDHRPFDLSGVGGLASVDLAGHRIQRLSAGGPVEFEWDAWDWLLVEDWIEPPASARLRSPTDFDHPNSLDLDADGNYVVSWRHLGEVTSINGETGEVLWRLGGRNNEFTFVDDPFGGFSGQHMARVLDNGHLLLFDNGLRHDPPESRAVEYALDLEAMTATMVWQYRNEPALYSAFVSGAERHQNGNTLVGFGVPARIVEVDADGGATWSAQITWQGSPAVFYRAHAVPSLYGYERP